MDDKNIEIDKINDFRFYYPNWNPSIIIEKMNKANYLNRQKFLFAKSMA